MKEFFTVSQEDTPIIAIYIFFMVFALTIGIIGYLGKLDNRKHREDK